MVDSDYAFVAGDPINEGSHGTDDYLFSRGNPVTNSGQSEFVFQSGTGLGGVAELVAHYDATATDVLLSNGSTVGDGEAIDEWVDIESGFDATGGSPVRRDNALNGNTAVEFNGPTGDDYLTVSPENFQLIEPPLTVIAVVIGGNLSTANTENVLGGHPDSNEYVNLRWASKPKEWTMDSISTSLAITGTGSSPPLILSAIYDGPDSLLRENGSTTGTGSIPDGTDSINIGNNHHLNRALGGPIGEVKIYNGNLLDAGGLESEEDELSSKWGI